MAVFVINSGQRRVLTFSFLFFLKSPSDLLRFGCTCHVVRFFLGALLKMECRRVSGTAMERDTPEFVCLLTEVQSTLESYVRVLVSHQAAARDIVQESNLTIWKKASEFQEGTNFTAWAVRIAYFEVLKYRRKVGREKLVFDDDVINLLADRNAELLNSSKEKDSVLQECLQYLSAENRALLRQRYLDGTSVKEIAERQGKSQGSISQGLYRIRESLVDCVARKLRRIEGT